MSMTILLSTRIMQHFDGNFHLSMTLVSPDFEGMSLIERHQLVYKAVDEYMHVEIHALTMKTLTPQEYKNTQQ